MINLLNVVRPNNTRLGVPSSIKYSQQFSSSSPFVATTYLHGKVIFYPLSMLFFDSFCPTTGKVAIVTGSSRSIGAAVAKCLGEHGANVVVNYINNVKAADEVVQSIRSQGKGGAIAVKADASTMDGGRLLLQEAIKTFGKVDILVLNAGIAGSRTLAEIDEAFFDAHFAANVKAPLFMAKTTVPLLPSRTPFPFIWRLASLIRNLVAGGRIIFFSSNMTTRSSMFFFFKNPLG